MEKHELERNLESVADNVKVTDLEAETKLSRLFYLQLYSSVLNAERLNKRRERVRRRKQLLTDTKKKVAKSLGWMDLGAWLSRSISSTEQDKDIGDIESVMVDRFDSRMNSVQGSQRYSGQGGPGPRGGAGAGRAAQPGYNLSSNAIYGQSGAVYGHGHHGKGGDYGPSQGHYGQGGYLLGYERAGAGPRLDHLREVETVSASSGSVNARRRNNRGTLEQVNEGESTDSRGEEEARSLGRRTERHRSNSRVERGSVASRDISVRRGSVASQQRLEPAARPGSRLASGSTYNRAAAAERKSSPPTNRKSASPTFSGDETDKDFQFVGHQAAASSDKTLKYDSKNFSFRLKNRDSVVISESRGRWSWRHACCNSLYLGLAVTILVFVIMLLSTSPHNYRGHYVSSNVPGGDISAPKFSLCLPVPYVKERAFSAGLTAQLASFLLYSLSPFNPNPDILDNKDLLTELTKQYKVLESRRGSGIRKVLRSAAPTCPEVVRACQLASRQILRGEDCCRLFFKQFRYQPEGYCIEGKIADKDEASAFPLGPDIQARLTVIINTGLVNMMDLDHRVVPWDTVRSRAVLVSVLHQDEVTWTRDPSRDILLWPGHTATITAYPHLTNNKGTLPNMVDCRSEPFPYLGQQAYSRSGCRNTVMQMIAEKSVNCSLMSLPPSPGSDLPTCGPLEGLALMYILKEQGDLVVQNPSIRNKFERNLMEKCPYECELKYWRSEVISSEVEEKVASLFGAEKKDISIIEFNHSNNKFVTTLFYESGFIVLVNRLGTVTGWLALIMIIIITTRKLCKARKRVKIKKPASVDEVVI